MYQTTGEPNDLFTAPASVHSTEALTCVKKKKHDAYAYVLHLILSKRSTERMELSRWLSKLEMTITHLKCQASHAQTDRGQLA